MIDFKDVKHVSLNPYKARAEYGIQRPGILRKMVSIHNNQYSDQAMITIREYQSYYDCPVVKNYRYHNGHRFFIPDSHVDTLNAAVEVAKNFKENTDIEITKDDKIYFSKDSSYPRHRLRNFTENKRTILKDKADYIVVPNSSYILADDEISLYKDQDDTYYIIEENNRYGYMMRDVNLKTLIEKETGRKDLSTLKEYMIHVLTTKGINLTEVKGKVFLTTNGSKENPVEIYMDHKDKLISEAQLDAYINSKGDALEMTDEQFTMLDNLLKSKEQQTVNLGLRTLNSFDTNKYLVPIALLLTNNIHNVCRCADWNSVGTKAIRQKIPYLKYNSVYGDKSLINLYNKIVDLCKTDLDRELIRRYGMPLIKADAERYVAGYLKPIKFINKYELIIE